ncbi:MAG: DUF2267 domain-containing protein, partial [Aestuariivirgaceae bacterium]
LLSLVRSHGDQNKVGELFDKIPGADDLADRYGSEEGRSGGLFGMLGGGLMGAPLAALAKLQSAGLDMPQIKLLGKTVLDHARENAGEDLVRDVTASIPGLNSYL